MLDGIIETALTTLLAQGAGWVIAVLLIVAIIFQSRKIDNLGKACDTQRDLAEAAVREQYEKRLTEFGIVLDVMGQSTTALNAMRDSVAARTEAVNQLVIGFANLVRDVEANSVRWQDRGNTITSQLENIRSRVEEMQRRLP